MIRTKTTADLCYALLRELFIYNEKSGNLALANTGDIWEPQIWYNGMNDSHHPMLKISNRLYYQAHIVWIWHYESEPRRLYHRDGNTMNTKIGNLSMESNAEGADRSPRLPDDIPDKLTLPLASDGKPKYGGDGQLREIK